MSGGARVLLFTGKGKGKTTSALGMAMRAAGHGLNVCLVQFVKDRNRDTGESEFLKACGAIELVRSGLGYVPEKSNAAFNRHAEAAREGLSKAAESIRSGTQELIIMDEVCAAIQTGLLGAEEVCGVVREAKEGQIIAMTGRNAPPELVAVSDTVTEMRCIKHAYNNDRPARKGVEF